MGLMDYIFPKVSEEVMVADNGFTTTKFAIVAGSIAVVLFGTGYALYGLGSVAKPISDIIEELNDSHENNMENRGIELDNIELEELNLSSRELEECYDLYEIKDNDDEQKHNDSSSDISFTDPLVISHEENTSEE